MLFPKFSEALEAVLFIALHSGADPVSSKQICASQNMLPRHLEPVLQILVKSGILKGTKGPRGGYSLAKEKRRIFLDEIFFLVSAASDKSINKHKDVNMCNLTDSLNNDIKSNIKSYLCKITIEDLCGKLKEGDTNNNKAEFNI